MKKLNLKSRAALFKISCVMVFVFFFPGSFLCEIAQGPRWNLPVYCETIGFVLMVVSFLWGGLLMYLLFTTDDSTFNESPAEKYCLPASVPVDNIAPLAIQTAAKLGFADAPILSQAKGYQFFLWTSRVDRRIVSFAAAYIKKARYKSNDEILEIYNELQESRYLDWDSCDISLSTLLFVDSENICFKKCMELNTYQAANRHQLRAGICLDTRELCVSPLVGIIRKKAYRKLKKQMLQALSVRT